MNVLVIVSSIIFFGFVILGINKFGLLSAYSSYAQKWKCAYKIHNFNIWSFVTLICALLLMPPLLEYRANTTLQFVGFLAPISLSLVAFTPNYEYNKIENIIHQIGAWGAVGFVLIYCIIAPKLFVVIGTFAMIAVILSFIYPAYKNTYIFWGEMAIYLSMYINLIILNYI